MLTHPQTKKKNGLFSLPVLLTYAIKFIVYLLAIGLYLFFIHRQIPAFLITFLLMYMLSEIALLSGVLKKSKKNEKFETSE